MVSWPLTLTTVIVWSALRPVKQGLFLAWLAGLFLDGLVGQTLGKTSLIFLFLTLPVYFYKNRFQADRWQFLVPWALIVGMIVNFLAGLPVLSLSLLVNGLLILFFLPILSRLAGFSRSQEEKSKLFFEKKL